MNGPAIRKRLAKQLIAARRNANLSLGEASRMHGIPLARLKAYERAMAPIPMYEFLQMHRHYRTSDIKLQDLICALRSLS